MIFTPSIPPAALISSTANLTPFRVDVPNVDSEPVVEPYSPMTISDAGADPPPVPEVGVELLVQPLSKAAPVTAAKRNARERVDARGVRMGFSYLLLWIMAQISEQASNTFLNAEGERSRRIILRSARRFLLSWRAIPNFYADLPANRAAKHGKGQEREIKAH